MRFAWIGQLVAESLGGGIDSRKEINLWLLQTPLLVSFSNLTFVYVFINETSQTLFEFSSLSILEYSIYKPISVWYGFFV